jgi:hypothetical protein
VYARSHANNRPLSAAVEDAVLQIRHRRAQEAANARSQIRPEAEVLNPNGGELPQMEAASDAAPFSITDDVVDPLGYALLSPAPWQARSLTELAASGEMLIWYALIVGSILVWRAPSHQRLFMVCVLAYGIANWIVLAVSEGNLGNLLRHRVALAPALLVLGSGGLEWLFATYVSFFGKNVAQSDVSFLGKTLRSRTLLSHTTNDVVGVEKGQRSPGHGDPGRTA